MRFRKRAAWEPPPPICVLMVRCLDVPSDTESPDGWRIVTVDEPSRNVLPGEHGEEANERLINASAELVLELLRRDEPVGPAIESGMACADSLATQWRGVIVDPIAQRVVMPGDWQVADKVYDMDPREHVAIHTVAASSGLWVHTHGLAKFGRPELEVFDIPEELATAALALVLDTSAYVIDGPVISPGNTLGPADKPLRAFEGTREADHWDGVPVIELRGVGASMAETLRAS